MSAFATILFLLLNYCSHNTASNRHIDSTVYTLVVQKESYSKLRYCGSNNELETKFRILESDNSILKGYIYIQNWNLRNFTISSHSSYILKGSIRIEPPPLHSFCWEREETKYYITPVFSYTFIRKKLL